MESVKHRTMTANGIRQHYIDAGHGPAVVLLHGFPFTNYTWRNQIPELSKKYRVIAPDLRGYGETDKPVAGHVRSTPWDQLQRLYFTSYALWNYLSTPFLFTRPGFELRELEPHQEGGDVWRRLLVKYPSDIPTHSDEQTLYFSEKGLLQRVDYETDVLGGIAAHYCYDHLSFGGIVFPTLRRVVTRKESHSFLSNPTAVLLLLSDILRRITQSRRKKLLARYPGYRSTRNRYQMEESNGKRGEEIQHLL